MGSIPLVALAENPQPTPQNPLVPMEQAAQIQGQRTSNQQQQVALKQQQLQLQDQETLRDLMPQFVKKDANGGPAGYDFNGLIQAAQGKVLPQTLFALQQQQSTMRQAAATATKDELANQDTLNKNLYQRVEGLRRLTDPNDRQSHYQDTIMYAQQHGIGTNDWPAQAPTNDQLDGVEAELGMHAQTLADQKTAAETAAAQAKGLADRYKEVNGQLMDLAAEGGPKPVIGQGMTPQEYSDAVDNVIPPTVNPELNKAVHAEVDFATKQGKYAQADAALKAGLESVSQISNETNPKVMDAKLKLATMEKQAEQVISDGDPKAAAQLLIDGTVAPSQLVSSRKPAFAQQAFSLAAQLKPGWSATKADADYKVASSPQNVAFFGSAKSLTDPGGTLDQLKAVSKDIPANQIPVFNTVADAIKASTGSGPIAKYAALLLGVADDYSKVMGGGQGSDTSRTQAMKIIAAKLSPEQRDAAIEGVRGAVGSQAKSRIGNNAVLQKMYGDNLTTGAAGSGAGGVPAGATHTAMGSDGKRHFTNAAGQDLGVAQ